MKPPREEAGLGRQREILLVGSYPPPVGGCSVHVQRLTRRLRARNDVHVIDLYGEPGFSDEPHLIRCGKIRSTSLYRACRHARALTPELVHFHVSSMRNFLYAGEFLRRSVPRNSSKIITIHSGSFVISFSSRGMMTRRLLASLLHGFDHMIVVNQQQRDFLEEIGFKPDGISVIPAFLPPVPDASRRVADRISDVAKKGKRIVLTSGYGLDYYGYHHIVAAIKELNEKTKGMHLILCLYNTFDEKYINTIEHHLRKQISLDVFRDLDPNGFSYILSKSDVYIRATDRDGDAVAIREAAFFGKKVVASDAVPRPDGSILFRLGDPEALAEAISRALGNEDCGLLPNDGDANFHALMEVYDAIGREC